MRVKAGLTSTIRFFSSDTRMASALDWYIDEANFMDFSELHIVSDIWLNVEVSFDISSRLPFSISIGINSSMFPLRCMDSIVDCSFRMGLMNR